MNISSALSLVSKLAQYQSWASMLASPLPIVCFASGDTGSLPRYTSSSEWHNAFDLMALAVFPSICIQQRNVDKHRFFYTTSNTNTTAVTLQRQHCRGSSIAHRFWLDAS
jgi:hypothetical protein